MPGARSRAPSWRELLLEKSGFEGGRVFFTLGGADANEHAVKFARQAPGKPHGTVIARDRCYHGASYATMALSGDSRTRTKSIPRRSACSTCRRPMPIAVLRQRRAEECGSRAASAVAARIDRAAPERSPR